MVKVFLQTMQSENKTIEYIQTRLRSASDVFKLGGHVTAKYRDQQFRLHFDNKRVIQAPDSSKTSLHVLQGSDPVKTIKHCENLRFISKLPKISQYSKYSNSGIEKVKYKNGEDIAIKCFIKGLLSEPPLFSLHRRDLKDYKSIID